MTIQVDVEEVVTRKFKGADLRGPHCTFVRANPYKYPESNSEPFATLVFANHWNAAALRELSDFALKVADALDQEAGKKVEPRELVIQVPEAPSGIAVEKTITVCKQEPDTFMVYVQHLPSLSSLDCTFYASCAVLRELRDKLTALLGE